jgi:hypothetical protein
MIKYNVPIMNNSVQLGAACVGTMTWGLKKKIHRQLTLMAPFAKVKLQILVNAPVLLHHAYTYLPCVVTVVIFVNS